VFDSTARDVASGASDVDLLVEFRNPDRSPARRFFGLLHQLEDTLGCEVDLLTTASLRNPYFRERVLKERIPIYEG
jgi:predicted nucleotidyltransferase